MRVHPWTQTVTRWCNQQRTIELADLVGEFVRPDERVLNVGAGPCLIDECLQARGYQIMPLDIRDGGCSPLVRPVLYDGHRFPFADDTFDVAIILFVLHHIADQDVVLDEVRRVARRVLIAEDLLTGPWQRYFTYAWDSLLNFEFIGHPHTNRTDEAWRDKFHEHGWFVSRYQRKQIWGMTNGIYELERN